MKTMKNKLSDRHGVSILFALLLMLVVAMVSVVMLSASLTAVKRTHTRKNVTQETLNMDSTALMIKNNISNAEITVTKDDKGNASSTNADGILKTELDTISRAYLDGNEISGNFKLKITDSDNKKLSTINVNYSLNKVLTSGNTSAWYVKFKIQDNNDPESQLFVHYSLDKTDDTTGTRVGWHFIRISSKEAIDGE